MIKYRKVIDVPSHVSFKTKEGKTLKVRCRETKCLENGRKIMTENCDMCETPLVSIQRIAWGLRLCHHRKGPYDGPEMEEPELDSSYYFCNLGCLKEWLNNKKLPKTPDPDS